MSRPAIIRRPRAFGAALPAAAALALLACATGPERNPIEPIGEGVEARPDGGGDPLATADEVNEPAETPAPEPALPAIAGGQLPPTDAQRRLDALLGAYLGSHSTRRVYIAADKPLYQPGESIWFSASIAPSATLIASSSGDGVSFQLISPRGSTVMTRRVLIDPKGVAANDFPLPAELPGGEYTIQARADDGASDERKVIVASYEAPRLKKALEFNRKAYGPGDPVSAAVSVARATGEPFAGRLLTAVATVDEVELARMPLTTDAAGNAIVRFTLPRAIARGDALLSVMAEEGGVTESIQKRVPVLLKQVKLQLFPEGGDLIAGLPGRVYFSAENPLGKPADVEGRVVADSGAVVARFRSIHDGMGRFAFTPQQGRRYSIELTRPTGIAEHTPLPEAKPSGCALRTLDDFESREEAIKVEVLCTEARTVVLEAVQREVRVASASAEVRAWGRPGGATVVALPVARHSQGVVRVTLFGDSQKLEPLAERLVYRGRGADLVVKVVAAREKLSPRDPVELTIETRDSSGRPVQARVGVSVVDDTVLSYADDKAGHLLSHLYLEKELPAARIEEPDFYFGKQREAGAALDAVLGSKGWRRFEWQLVLAPPPPRPSTASLPRGFAMADAPALAPAAPPPADVAKGGRPAKVPAHAAGVDAKPAEVAGRAGVLGVLGRGPGGGGRGELAAAAEKKEMRRALEHDKDLRGDRLRGRDDAMAGLDLEEAQGNAWAWAPVRQFPVPDYSRRTLDENTPRTDFRETLYWNPAVDTGEGGRATVKFFLSDAVTSFRASVEGGSQGGLLGRGDAVIQSKLPLSVEAKLPLEVSSGDTIKLPVTLANETDRALDARLESRFGAALRLKEDPARAPIHLAPGERRSMFFDLDVIGSEGEGEVVLSTSTEGLRDELRRKIRVVPLGFPQHASFAGTVQDRVHHEIDLESALPRSLTASVTLYPSPLTTMVKGAEGILREPGGCFEQTSSSNYPNVMVSQYLATHDAADPKLLERAHGLLQRGYKMLTAFESPKKGYEWFGGDPGHEALTAYGLLEFTDMAKVYGDVDRAMIERTAKWLYGRRDGKGGFERNARALDSFGAAPKEVTDGYITWALTESGRRDLDVEIQAQRKVAAETADPYLLALAANTLANVKDAAAASSVERLASLQAKDGGFPGAKTSITRSGGQALGIETTALAALALLKGGASHEAALRAAASWITKQDNGFGAYGSTQSTVLALRALNAYAEHSRRTASPGVAEVYVNGKPAGRVAFEAGRSEPIAFEDLAGALERGKNTVEIRLASQSPLPYAVSLDWRTRLPSSSADAKVLVSTKLAVERARMGESVRLHAVIENVAHDSSGAPEGVPMTLARIGLPGGLAFQTWQLKELRDKGLCDFYETRPREVILYFRSLAPSAKRSIDLDLQAVTPGRYVAPASSAYLYYTNELKSWADPVLVDIAP